MTGNLLTIVLIFIGLVLLRHPLVPESHEDTLLDRRLHIVGTFLLGLGIVLLVVSIWQQPETRAYCIAKKQEILNISKREAARKCDIARRKEQHDKRSHDSH